MKFFMCIALQRSFLQFIQVTRIRYSVVDKSYLLRCSTNSGANLETVLTATIYFPVRKQKNVYFSAMQ